MTAPQAHHRLFARSLAMVLTNTPVRDAVRSLLALSRRRADALQSAIRWAERSETQRGQEHDRAVALLEMALDDLERLKATA